MYACVYVQLYTYIYMYTNRYTHTYIYIYGDIHIYIDISGVGKAAKLHIERVVNSSLFASGVPGVWVPFRGQYTICRTSTRTLAYDL